MDCPIKYTGQTGRTFQARYKEHTQKIRYNANNSGYSNPVLNTGYAYESTTCTMQVLKIEKKENT
jgi:hypothetical protein